MEKTLSEELAQLLTKETFKGPTCEDFKQRLQLGHLTRDEDPATHYCVYFLPYDPATKQVLFVHHKKAGIWLSPGGHIDKGETLLQALNREINEELGVQNKFKELRDAFFISTVDIDRPGFPCKKHYDTWYLMPTSADELHIDPHEFHGTRWVSLQQAHDLSDDPANKKAMEVLGRLYS